MFQGHGGHGSVVAAKLLAQAAAKSGYQAQSFASYGALRRGGKVEGYVRISEEKVLLRCKMYSADYLVIMDDSLLEDTTTLRAAKEGTIILINTSKVNREDTSLNPFKVFTVDANAIAEEKGLIIPGGMPVINTTLLGALAGVLKAVPIEDMVAVIRDSTPNPEKNAECAMEGYRRVAEKEEKDSGEKFLAKGWSPRKKRPGRFPSYHEEKMGKCHRCQICYMVCPSLAITFESHPLKFIINTELCAGCGICIHECPRRAISWEEQGHD
jgi:pyruvate ferredoxin oxidoreductase gamma subunit